MTTLTTHRLLTHRVGDAPTLATSNSSVPRDVFLLRAATPNRGLCTPTPELPCHGGDLSFWLPSLPLSPASAFALYTEPRLLLVVATELSHWFLEESLTSYWLDE